MYDSSDVSESVVNVKKKIVQSSEVTSTCIRNQIVWEQLKYFKPTLRIMSKCQYCIYYFFNFCGQSGIKYIIT